MELADTAPSAKPVIFWLPIAIPLLLITILLVTVPLLPTVTSSKATSLAVATVTLPPFPFATADKVILSPAT